MGELNHLLALVNQFASLLLTVDDSLEVCLRIALRKPVVEEVNGLVDRLRKEVTANL